ncbi:MULTISPECIES: hypothetical protein [unclassified Nocardiopsis]|uniref:hypothetical protein n=1 Tax=unclassified Nocardiopsis TaxID=2649073 RepID=UPI0033F11BDB
MNLRLRGTWAASLALLLPFGAASSVLAAPVPQTDLESLGTAESTDSISSGLTAEAHAAERNASGNLLSLTWSVENQGSSEVDFDWPQGTTYMYSNRMAYSGVTILSSNEGTRFHPVMDSAGDCLCSGNNSMDSKNFLRPGEKVVYWSMFSVPEDVESVDLEIPGFDPIEDVPLS